MDCLFLLRWVYDSCCFAGDGESRGGVGLLVAGSGSIGDIGLEWSLREDEDGTDLGVVLDRDLGFGIVDKIDVARPRVVPASDELEERSSGFAIRKPPND